jgi:hypothetical protein
VRAISILAVFAGIAALGSGCAQGPGLLTEDQVDAAHKRRLERDFVPSGAADAAVVKARWHWTSAWVYEVYRPLSIDGKDVHVGHTEDQTKQAVPIDPGTRSFVIDAEFNRGDGIFKAKVPVKASLRPGTTYQLNGEISEGQVTVWLEEEKSRERASEPASAKPERLRIVPIFIPIR